VRRKAPASLIHANALSDRDVQGETRRRYVTADEIARAALA
jgi:hypothetical protein